MKMQADLSVVERRDLNVAQRFLLGVVSKPVLSRTYYRVLVVRLKERVVG